MIREEYFMKEQEIRFASDEIQLSGTMTFPDSAGPFPMVLLITGSGQVDRNENHKKMHLNAFYDISHYLAQNGIASLRYDKRGVGQSEGDYWSTGFYDHVQDAQAAIKFVKKQENIQSDHIFVLGHSEGSFIATKLAGDETDIAGIILVSGGAQSGEAVLKWQAIQIAKGMKGINGWLIRTLHINVSKAQQKQLEKIKTSQKDWYRQQMLVKINARWLREFMAYNPSDDLRHITIPVLAITGSKDIQVDPQDLEKMASLIKSPFEHHIIQDMTHLLRIEHGEASLSRYKEEILQPISPKLLEIILDWLQRRVELQSKHQA
jgi:pimeloyl-ACP methyl ester carboxylesterase